MSERLLNIQKASEMLGVSQNTLRYWDESGKFEAVKTAGGHRRYRLRDIEDLQGIKHDDAPVKDKICLYCRVSSSDQKKKGDLDRQKSRVLDFCLKKKYNVVHSLSEVGSGMNDKRSKLRKLFTLVETKQITKVIVEHKDRLARFNFGVYESYFNSHGVVIEHMGDKRSKTYEQELVDDMISLMSSFSAKIYGKRSAENRRQRKLEKEKQTAG